MYDPYQAFRRQPLDDPGFQQPAPMYAPQTPSGPQMQWQQMGDQQQDAGAAVGGIAGLLKRFKNPAAGAAPGSAIHELGHGAGSVGALGSGFIA